MICPICKSPINKGDRFCENCGAPLGAAAEPAADAAPVAFCEQCGNKLTPGDRFCENCGTPVAQAEQGYSNPVFASPSPAVAPLAATCSNCGAPIVDGDRFCENCGTPVAQSAPSFAPELSPAYETQSAPAFEPEPAPAPAVSVAPPAVVATSMLMLMGENGKTYSISSFPSVAGKGSAADTLIAGDESVSRTHARFSKIDDKITIEDLNSTNKTYLNGVALVPHEAVALKSGDELKFGDTVLTVDLR